MEVQGNAKDMFAVALAFFLGDGWVQCVPALTAAWLLPPVAATLAFALCMRRRRVMTSALAFVLGLVWAAAHAQWQLQDDLASDRETHDMTVTGVIDDIPQREVYGWRFVLAVENNAQTHLPSRVQINWYNHDVTLHAGERWMLLLRLKRRHGFANPGGFDYEGQLFREGIGATGYVRDSSANIMLGVASGHGLVRVREFIAERISRAVPDSPMQGVMRGLAVGDQQAISGDQWQVFARTGISHLIAISGSHIGMVAFLFAWLGGLLVHLPVAQRWRLTRHDLQAGFGLPAAFGYSLLAGMSVPTQRTLVMLCVFFISRLLRREVNVWHSFGLALLLVTVLDPFAPLAIGTWLSFGAVAAILLHQQGRLLPDLWWREFLSLQAVVTLGLLPFLLSAFGNVSLISPLVNLLAIPVFTFVLVPGVLSGCVLLALNASFGTWWLLHLAHFMNWLYSVLQSAAALPMAAWYVPQSPLWAMLLLGAGVLLMVLPLLWPMRMCGLLCCLPALLWQPEKLPLNAFELTALDVGQGLSLVVRTATHVLVYDTGPKFQSGTDTGELVVLPYLHSLGVRDVDAVMISHGDDDHAGGMVSVQHGIRVQQWLLGPSVQARALVIDDNLHRCHQGQHWLWDAVQFDVLSPGAAFNDQGRNNTSCVLRIHAAGGSALLPGDAEAPVEARLVGEGVLPVTCIVVAGHHGSRTSSTQELVDAVHAQQVIFSAGYRNRWGFPKPDVVSRWELSGAQVHSTITGGAITLRVMPNGMQPPQLFRELHHHYWQAN